MSLHQNPNDIMCCGIRVTNTCPMCGATDLYAKHLAEQGKLAGFHPTEAPAEEPTAPEAEAPTADPEPSAATEPVAEVDAPEAPAPEPEAPKPPVTTRKRRGE